VAQCDHASWRGLGYGFAQGVGPGAATEADVRVAQSAGGMTMPNKPVAQWSTDFTRFESVASLGGRVEADLQIDGNRITGVVRNGTRQRLGNVCLSYGQFLYRLPVSNGGPPAGAAASAPLEPGAEAKVSIELGRTASLPFGAPPTAGSADSYNNRVFASMLSTLGRGVGTPLDVPPVLLCGQFESAPYTVSVDAPISKQSAHGVFALEADLRRVSATPPTDLPPGRWIATGGGLNSGGRGQRYHGPVGGIGGPENPWMPLNRSSAVFAATAPFGGPATALSGMMPISRQGTGGDNLEVEIFDFASFEWRRAMAQTENLAPSQPPQSPVPGTMMPPAYYSAMHDQGNQAVRFNSAGPANALHPLTNGAAVRVIHVPDQSQQGFGRQPCMVLLPTMKSLTLAPPEENAS
jgi:hypothetical protein